MSTPKVQNEDDQIDPNAGILKSMIMNIVSGRGEQPEHWLKLYKVTLAEASKMHREAIYLIEGGFHERAYFIAMQSLEELSKALMAADVYTCYATEDDYNKFKSDHKRKIKRVTWIKYEDQKFPIYDVRGTKTNDFDFRKKLLSTYTDVESGSHKILRPSEAITEEDAKSIINAVYAGLIATVRKTMIDGEQIGTKGFMK